jgi:mitochondrial-processing peptidase subunit alpha
MERLGMSFLSTTGVDFIVSAATTLRSECGDALELIANSYNFPLYLPEEIQAEKEQLSFLHEDEVSRPDTILASLVHKTCFSGSSLAQWPMVEPESIAHLSINALRDYMSAVYVGERLIVGGVGVEHEWLVEQAHRHFGHLRR